MISSLRAWRLARIAVVGAALLTLSACNTSRRDPVRSHGTWSLHASVGAPGLSAAFESVATDYVHPEGERTLLGSLLDALDDGNTSAA